MKILKHAASILGIVIAIVALPMLPTGFLISPFSAVRWFGFDSLPKGAIYLWVFSPPIMAVAIGLIAVSTRLPKPPSSLAIALLGIAANSRAFLAPHLCGLAGLICSFIGIALSVLDVRQRSSEEPPVFAKLGLAANSLVGLFSLLYLTGGIRTHLIDLVENNRLLVTVIQLTPEVVIILFLASVVSIWVKIRNPAAIISISVLILAYLGFLALA
ncbi:MAG: hypothetical protein F9B45_24570 [Phycisphaera sp. RhM]|nr:hypothetical protein [Phycisphaera sp. RhM]